MRISVFVRTAFLLLAIASPLLVRAQFQPPTAEELKMTADPKAPGAAAVYLNIEEVANDPLHFQSLHVRIKILQEKGKELATVELPYLKGDTKITEIQARTIHSDGTVIPMTGKPEDLLISKSEGRQYGRKVFTLPSVEVGSILEYYYQLHYDQNSFMSPYWEIQRPYYVHKAHFTFTPYGDFMPGGQNGGGQSGESLLHLLVDEHGDRVNTLVWWPVLPPGVTVKTESTGRYTVDISDVPPMPDEEWMPPVQNFLYKVLFYYKSASNVDDFWGKFAPVKPVEVASNHLRWEIKDMPALDLENIHATPAWGALAARMSIKWGDAAVKGADNQWRAIGLWQEHLEEHRPDPTPEISAKALELTAGAPGLYTKLSRITDYIQKNIRYFIVARGIGGWQAHYAGDIYRNRYGDCKDKTTLLISMLQAIGIRAYYLHVDSRRGIIDPAAPSLAGNHMITAIELPEGENDPRLLARVKAANGKTLLIFDPTDEETPVGLIRAALQGAYGNISNGPDSQVLLMPLLPPDAAGLNRKGSFTLTADGALAGDIAEVFTGDDATSERWFIKDNDSRQIREKLERDLGSDLPGLAFKGFEFRRASELDQPLDLDLHFSATGYAHAAGPLLLLRPRILGSHARAVPDVMEGKPRNYPIELGHPGRWRDSFDIAIPEGYVVDESPNPVNIDVDFASYHSAVSAKGNLLHYESEYIVRQVEIPPAKAASFRQLENVILSGENGTAVLKKQ